VAVGVSRQNHRIELTSSPAAYLAVRPAGVLEMQDRAPVRNSWSVASSVLAQKLEECESVRESAAASVAVLFGGILSEVT